MTSARPDLLPAVEPAAVAPMADDPLWYKDAIIYQVHVRGFYDSTGDGIGDFVGLSQKLDYIQSLGVSAIWLQPFYPSPLRDDGYDIAHYQGVHPSYGTRRDFRAFLEAAHARNIRVITELVINHTSDQHPWFQAARRARPGSPKRNFYVWSDTDQRYAGVRIIFTDTERSNWTWDPVANAYYWHRFFHHQPDLNFDNPHVQRAVIKVMRFWLDQGVDGMRLDAVPYLIEREGTICENLPETHDILRQIRAALDASHRNRMLLAEANQWPSDVRAYFGETGDECHMAFHFPLMPRLFMALRQEDRHPISEILYQTPSIPDACQWAIFLRNHDELTLEMVTDEERDYMYQAYANDPQMRLNVGIRRRLAQLVENSRPRIELLNSLLFSLPGTPIVYYGDEIGMGDNIYLGDRNGVRTPMQWTADRNAGFSRCDPARLYAPIIMDSVFGYQSVNVEAQERSPFSLLNWMRRMIALRQQHRTFGRGGMELLRPENRRIFAFLRRHASDDPILVVANLSRTVQSVSLDLSRFSGLVPVEMTGNSELPHIGDGPYFLTLGPYACYWLLLRRQAPSPITVRALPQPDRVMLDESPLLLGPDWRRLLESSTRDLLERQYLPPFLKRQRWFARRSSPLRSVRIADWGTVRPGAEPVLLTVLAAQFDSGEEDRYVVPLTIAAGSRAEDIARQTPDALVARVAGARKGVISSHLDPSAGAALLELVGRSGELPLRHGRARAFALRAFHDIVGAAAPDDLTPTVAGVDQSNTSVRYGERMILKIVRRVWPGMNPELELGRFLTEEASFSRVPRLAGGIEYDIGSGQPATLAVLHQTVEHQTDGWKHALGELERYLDAASTWDPARAAAAPPADLWLAEIPEAARQTIGGYLETAGRLGRRTAELHLAFASPAAGRTIGLGVLDREEIAEVERNVLEEAAETIEVLETLPRDVPQDIVAMAHLLVTHRDRMSAAIREAAAGIPEGLQITRVHGDYHLGQVLLHEQDFSIVDFEGEPTRSIEERRRLQSPLKDVAGMVRSYHYAAGAAAAARHVVAPKDMEKLGAWARWWQTWVTASFLEAYHSVALGALFLPADTMAATSLLRLLLFEKALYEIRYELNHRPAWLRIPVAGVLDLIGTTGEEPGIVPPVPS
jgi:maltose alpha-D-glucosyltransferase/alpha-amylase